MLVIDGQELKFNFRAFFRANNILSSQAGANDGASQLWIQFVTGDEMAVYNALKVLLPKAKEDEIVDIIDRYADDGELDALTDSIEAELHRSAFFQRAAKRWLNLVEKYQVSKKPKTEEEKLQAKVMNDTMDAVKKSLS